MGPTRITAASARLAVPGSKIENETHKHVSAEFAHHPVPDWSESRRTRSIRIRLNTIASPGSAPWRATLSTMQTVFAACLQPMAVASPPWTDNICEICRLSHPDRLPCTLRLRRNYGLRGPGYSPPAAPPAEDRGPCWDARSAAGIDLQRRWPVRQGRVTIDFVEGANTTMLVLKRLAAFAAVIMPVLTMGGWSCRPRPALALATGLPAIRDRGHGPDHLVPRPAALHYHRI